MSVPNPQRVLALCVLWGMCQGIIAPATAETIEQALIKVYQDNPQLNFPAVRAIVAAEAGIGREHAGSLAQQAGAPTCNRSASVNTASIVSIITQSALRDGHHTANRKHLAEAELSAGCEMLRLIEQTTLLKAATTYMDLLRDGALLELMRRNFVVLQELMRQSRDRFDTGAVTLSEVAQVELDITMGRARVARAEAQYARSKVTYLQVIGFEGRTLAPAAPVERLMPRRLPEAIDVGRARHPDVGVARLAAHAAALRLKINEGSLHQGAAEDPLIREATATVAQKQKDLDAAHDIVRTNVVAAWDRLDAAKTRILAAQSHVAATEIALNNLRQQARVDRGMTPDVLNAQQELVDARVALVTAQHDRVVASYALLAAVGELNMHKLGIKLSLYDPTIYYQHDPLVHYRGR